ncbi:MAG: transposase [Thermoanaerobaculia bacterium]
MARQRRIEFPGAVYHAISRGIERRSIFSDDVDRERYLGILERAVARFRFQLYAYCLMDNHVHLAIEVGKVPLSRIMRSVNTSYAGYFNVRHRRSGYLFQSRYKAFLVDGEEYLLSLIRYIHENPVRAGIVAGALDYTWSSHRSYLEGGPVWLSADPVLERFGNRKASARRNFAAFFQEKEERPYEQARRFVQTVVGEPGFAQQVLELPGLDEFAVKRMTVGRLCRWFAGRLEIKPSQLRSESRERRLSEARSLCAHLGREVAGLPIAAIAREFNRAQSSLWRNVQSFERKMAGNPGLQRRVGRLRSDLVREINNT